MLAFSLRKVEEEYFSWMISFKKNKVIKTCIEDRWKLLNIGKEETIKEDEKQKDPVKETEEKTTE